MHFKKIIKGTILALGVIAVVGYLTARLALPACEKDAYDEMTGKGVHGFEFGGKPVLLSDIKISSSVLCPFVVSVEYSIPQGFHASYHEKRYIALPWRNYRISSDDIYLVSHEPLKAVLIANNSFKPNTLRGGNVQRFVSFLLPPQSVSA